MHNVRAVAVRRHQRDSSGQVAAGAVAAHRDAGSVAVDGGRVIGSPDRGGVAVLRRAGELGLRGQAVVNGHHHATRALAKVAGRGVGRVQVADHPAAAVVPDQNREGAGTFGRVDANGNVAIGGRDAPVFHLSDLGSDRTGPGSGVDSRLLRRDFPHCRESQRGYLVDYSLCLRVQGHDVPPNIGPARRVMERRTLC